MEYWSSYTISGGNYEVGAVKAAEALCTRCPPKSPSKLHNYTALWWEAEGVSNFEVHQSTFLK